MKAYFDTYMEFFRENLPKLYNHLSQQKLTADLYIIDWYDQIFSLHYNETCFIAFIKLPV